MKDLNLDSILDIINEEKEKRGLENYVPCYPMLRMVDDKLFIAVLISNINENVWSINNNSKPEYWCLIDINTLKIIEFNKTEEKDYIIGNVSKRSDDKEELVKFEQTKEKEYENYLLNDIKNSQISLQEELSKSLNGKVKIDNKMVNVEDYMMENLEEVIKIKVKELVDILIQSKYGLITTCYDNIFNEILKLYVEKEFIDIEKIELCIRVMDNYYCGIVGIRELFNL